MTTDASALRTARRNAQSYDSDDAYKDILDYASLVNQLIPDPAISAAYIRLQTALAGVTIYEGHTGSSLSRSHGLSIYVPEPSDYTSYYKNNYENLSLSADFPNWASMIKAQTQ
jgi:hypothetical protein